MSPELGQQFMDRPNTAGERIGPCCRAASPFAAFSSAQACLSSLTAFRRSIETSLYSAYLPGSLAEHVLPTNRSTVSLSHSWWALDLKPRIISAEQLMPCLNFSQESSLSTASELKQFWTSIAYWNWKLPSRSFTRSFWRQLQGFSQHHSRHSLNNPITARWSVSNSNFR